MNIRLTALFFAGMVLSACAPGTETTVVEKTVPVLKEETQVSGLDSKPDQAEFQIIATKSYDGNKLYLTFRPNRSDLRIVSIKRTKSSRADEVATFEDINVIDSSEAKDTLTTAINDISPWEYKYQFVVSHPSFKENEFVTLEILQKKNLVVKEDTKLSDLTVGSNDLELADLVISKGKTLTLNGPSVKIRAENFVAEDGSTLENMTAADAETASPEAEPGKDGGVIRFEIEKASGFLKIVLRGGKGGKGTLGVHSNVKGPSGGPGADGTIGYPRRPREPRFYSHGDQQATLVARNVGTDDIEDPYCKRNPAPGFSGGTGGQGGPGGNNRGICPVAPTGPQGPNGPQGPTGTTGLDGSLGAFCTFRNDTSFSCIQETSYSGVL